MNFKHTFLVSLLTTSSFYSCIKAEEVRDRLEVIEELYTAIQNNDSAGIEKAIAEGAELIGTPYYRIPPLVAAMIYDNNFDTTEIMELLIAKGADFKGITTSAEMSYLMVAIIWDALNSCKVLINHGADVNALNNNGETALDIAYECVTNRIDYKHMEEIIVLLKSKDAQTGNEVRETKRQMELIRILTSSAMH